MIGTESILLAVFDDHEVVASPTALWRCNESEPSDSQGSGPIPFDQRAPFVDHAQETVGNCVDFRDSFCDSAESMRVRVVVCSRRERLRRRGHRDSGRRGSGLPVELDVDEVVVRVPGMRPCGRLVCSCLLRNLHVAPLMDCEASLGAAPPTLPQFVEILMGDRLLIR